MTKSPTFSQALAGLLLCSSAAVAQTAPAHHAFHNRGKSWPRISAILQKQQAALQASRQPVAKTTTGMERLIATSAYNFDGSAILASGKTDSARYWYNNDARGSVFNKDIVDFITPSGYYFTGGNPIGEIVATHTSPVQMYSGVLADSAYTWNSNITDTGGSYIYGLGEIISATYDAANNVTLFDDTYNPTDPMAYRSRYSNTYNAANDITSSISLYYNGTSWDTMQRVDYAYSAPHKLSQDSTSYLTGPGMWMASGKNIYTYSTGGNLTYALQMQDSSGTLVESYRTSITYNADNTIHTDSSSYSSGGVWMSNGTDSFGYTTGINYWTSLKEYQVEDTFFLEQLVTKHVSASGLPDSLYISVHDNYDGVAPSYLIYRSKIGYIYDAYSNSTTALNTNYNITDPASGAGTFDASPIAKNNYYYEPYGLTGIKEAASVAESIAVFPNPTSGAISISRPQAAKGIYTTVKFMNAIGQVVRTETMPWLNSTETFSIAGFPAGMYMVSIQNRNGDVLATSKIIKQ